MYRHLHEDFSEPPAHSLAIRLYVTLILVLALIPVAAMVRVDATTPAALEQSAR